MNRTRAKAGLKILVLWCTIGTVALAWPRNVVVFGDSTTAAVPEYQVYGQLLAVELSARVGAAVTVINAGVRGDTTEKAELRWQHDVLDHSPDLVVIQFGINDATIDVWKTPPATTSRVPLREFRSHVLKFIRDARAQGAQVVVMTPNPLSWKPRLVELYGRAPYDVTDPQGLNVNLARYAEAVRDLAHTEGVPLVDVWAAHEAFAREHQESLLLDGIHPNAGGHDLVARLLMTTLAAAGRGKTVGK